MKKYLNDSLRVYLDIIDALNGLDGYQFKEVADHADVCVSTLYNWINGNTYSPQLRTLSNVAWVLGYDIVLKKRTAKLRLVG